MNKPLLENMSILIAEDNLETRIELEEILALSFKFVYTADNGCTAVTLMKKYHPDIILADINMPCLDGYDVVKESKIINPNTLNIFTTAYSDTEHLLNAIDVHIDAYVVKPIKIDTLLKKITSLMDKVEKNTAHVKHQVLSPRELEVFLDIAKGIKPNVIAQKYKIKSKTISTYRQRIFEKMDIHNNADITRYALENRLV